VSQAAIRELADAHAFNARPRSQDQRQVYVPFDELLEQARVERRIGELLRAGGRVGLVGPTGSGKSSLLEHVLIHRPFARLSVPVSLDDKVAREPKVFAQHLVRALCRYGEESARAEQEERIEALAAGPAVGEGEAADADLGLLRGEAAFQFASSASFIDVSRPATEIARGAERLFELLRDHGLTPVLVVDDSDKWLSGAGDAMIRDFFGRVLPWIAELGAPMVVALQPAAYLDGPAYREARRAGVPEREVAMPALTVPAQLARILARRIEVAGVDEPVEAIFTAGAVAELYRYYADHAQASLRRTLNAANCAIDLAAEAGAAEVDEPLMLEGIAEH
jgi:hypothetical protein